MDELPLIVNRIIHIISSYQERCDDAYVSRNKKEMFHLIQAKQALLKAMVLKDPHDFVSRRLVKVYEGQLSSLVRNDEPVS